MVVVVLEFVVWAIRGANDAVATTRRQQGHGLGMVVLVFFLPDYPSRGFCRIGSSIVVDCPFQVTVLIR